MSREHSRICAASLILLASSAAWGQYTLIELQPLPGDTETVATSIDAQGRIVGSSRGASDIRIAVLWPSADEMPIPLGVLDGGRESEAVAISNGRVVGTGDRACGMRGAFSWRSSDGLNAFGPASCPETMPVSVNRGGVALLQVGAPAFPIVWPVDGGAPRFLETWGQAAAVFTIDDAGRVLGASAHHPEGGGRTRAIEWLADGTPRLLAPLDPFASGADAAVDRNASGLIVGQARLGGRSRATVWNGAGVPLDVGTVLGPTTSSSLAAVNEGGVAVGSSSLGAIVWDEGGGAAVLETLVDDTGNGWNLVAAQDVNADGTIIGNGLSPSTALRGFALVSAGLRCLADLDGDGSLTIFDFLAFQNLFDSGDPRADFDGDGSLTIFDFLAFQNAFDAGC